MKFSDKLQKIRKENNITQEGLADRLNVSRQAVSKWESGMAYPDTEKLIQISKIFNVRIDDLINDSVDMNKNKDSISKKLSFMEIFNQVLEFISKSINMFWSMKFTEKIKCLFEMGIISLIILLIAMISTSVLVNVLRRVLFFIPSSLVYSICGLFETLLFLVWIVLGIMIVVRMFKSRYLDYYVIVSDNTVSERVVEEPIKELKEKKEYKVVIRDPKDSSLHLFRRISRLFIFFGKCFCFFFALPLVLLFIFSMIMFIFSLFYILEGLFFNGISIAILGVLLIIYLMLEFIYNLIFNRSHMVNRIFIIFIVSISLIGAGIGLSFVSLTGFSYYENSKMDENIHNIEMSDDLVLLPLIHDIGYEKIVIDNEMDDIKLKITSYGNTDTYLYSYDSYNRLYGGFKVIELGYEFNEIDLYKDILNDLCDKKIVNYSKNYDVMIYVSSDNLTKLRENINKYYNDVYFE